MKWLLLIPSAASILTFTAALSTPAFAMDVGEAVRLCRKSPLCVGDNDPNGRDITILGPAGGVVVCYASDGGKCHVVHGPEARPKTTTPLSPASTANIKATIQGNAS